MNSREKYQQALQAVVEKIEQSNKQMANFMDTVYLTRKDILAMREAARAADDGYVVTITTAALGEDPLGNLSESHAISMCEDLRALGKY